MGIVLLDMAMSLDGIVRDSNGQSLYPIDSLRNTEALNEIIRPTGAVVMDRTAYEEANGNFIGYEYQVPIFILTDSVPENIADGENDKLRLYFVTDGIDKLFEHARRAAGHHNITIVGGPGMARLCLQAGLVDEIMIRHIPVLMNGGTRLFEAFTEKEIKLKIIRSIAFANRIDIRYRVIKSL